MGVDRVPEAYDDGSRAGPEGDLRLVESLHELLYREGLEDGPFEEALARLEKRHGDEVYSELIHLLSHLRFDPPEAKQHWACIRHHRDSMKDRLGAPVDLRVALVSYFVEINKKLKNPKVIELRLFEQTQASAYRDELTGLCNFRYFRNLLTREIQRGERFNLPLSLIMIDIDDFKTYNDRYGHEAGNEALATVARLMLESLRKIDVPARYGGEEFALILPTTSKSAALKVAQRTRERIENHVFPDDQGGMNERMTVSMGIASYPADAINAGELIRHADSALYVAKTLGKNQVHLYGESRRSDRRIEASLLGRFGVLSAEFHPLTTINLSTRGFLLRLDDPLPHGALVEVRLSLPGSRREVGTLGRVIRVSEHKDGKFEAALSILHIAPEDQAILVDFIRATEGARDRDEAGAPGGGEKTGETMAPGG